LDLPADVGLPAAFRFGAFAAAARRLVAAFLPDARLAPALRAPDAREARVAVEVRVVFFLRDFFLRDGRADAAGFRPGPFFAIYPR
jgi:hypothetical protein